MRHSLLVLLTVPLLAFIVRAQITSIKETGVTHSGKLGTVWQEVIENHGSSAIVALHATYKCPMKSKSGRSVASHGLIAYERDSLVNYSSARNVPPGGVVGLLAQDPSECSGGVDAVIFSDGHNEGDPDWVNEMYQRRRGVYDGITAALQLLDTIANQGANPADVADSVHRRTNSMMHDQTIAFEERLGQRQFYTGFESLLRSQMDLAVPSDSTSHQPRIEEVAKINGIPREQAHAIVISKKYQEWKAALEGNLEPPAAK
jgi:hypothetical protein